jgi:plastocyanin
MTASKGAINMKRRLLVVGIAFAVAATALTAAAFARHQSSLTLIGTVGPGYTIDLRVGGQKLVRLKAGSYKFVLHDKSSIHGWSLDGPNGFAKDLTPVPFTGTKTITLNLKAGKYKFYCPPHESQMFGHFSAVS